MKRKTRNAFEVVGEFISIFERRGYWYAHYRDNGNPCRVSLRTEKKKEARQKALAIERDLLEGRALRPKRAPTIEHVVEAYMSHLHAAGRSPKTLSKYKFCFDLVAKLAREKNISRIDQIDLQFIDQFQLQRMRHKNVRSTPTTQGQHR